MPKTAPASVSLSTCGTPQASRWIVAVCAPAAPVIIPMMSATGNAAHARVSAEAWQLGMSNSGYGRWRVGQPGRAFGNLPIVWEYRKDTARIAVESLVAQWRSRAVPVG